MQYTFKGMVRYGYGFDNPNHAAALICMIMPFLWWWRSSTKKLWLKVSIFCLELIFYTALIFTYSRTGFFVLLIEAVLWLILQHKNKISAININKKYFLFSTLILLLTGISYYTEAYIRYFSWMINPDRSVTNRIEVLKGSLAMLNDNLLGVGSGKSGFIFTNFYNCPENAHYKTLVNSFLTFLVEQGIIIGFITFSVIALTVFILLLDNKRKINRTLFCALVGALISGTMSTCFDLNFLFINPPREYSLNYFCLLILMVSFILLFISPLIINYKSLNKREIYYFAFGVVSAIFVLSYFIGDMLNRNPYKVKITDNLINLINKNETKQEKITVLNDRSFSLRYCANEIFKVKPKAKISLFLKTPKNPNEIIKKSQNIALFGKMNYYAHESCKPLYIFYPDESYFIEQPKNIIRVTLSKADRLGNNNYWIHFCENHKIKFFIK